IPDKEASSIIIRPQKPQVTIDGQSQPLSSLEVRENTLVSAYSFNYELEKIAEYKGKQPFMKWFIRHFPEQIPVDEAIIVYQEEKKDTEIKLVVEGIIQSIRDTSIVIVKPSKISYRGKDYTVDLDKLGTVELKPMKSVIKVGDTEQPLLNFQARDSLKVIATSTHPSVKQVRPFLATESFASWFKHSFPKVIPVDEISLVIPEEPFLTRFIRWITFFSGALLIMLFLMGTLLYWYYGIRIQTAKGKRRFYWVYRYTMLLLHQLGIQRRRETPLEFATQKVDPQFGTRMGEFMSLYLQQKYAPVKLESEDETYAIQFLDQFKKKVLKSYSRWDIIKHFLNFRRTLQFLLRG
ncbi:MAG: hypothetical protein D6732_23275, partial [Methanobacteriota archaeon]